MKININKTKVITIGEQQLDIKRGNVKVEQVKYLYPGAILDKSGCKN